MQRILFLLTIILLSSCSKKENSTFTLHGQINNSENKYILLQQESDIERKISKLIDTIKLDENGNFEYALNEEPHYYTLVLNENENIPLAIAKNQQITIESINSKPLVGGSKDTDLLNAYEKLRKESLDRLVNTIRKQIVAENKSENPNPKTIDSLGKLELNNYDLHLAELNAFIKNKMGTSIAIYPTSLRWKDNNIKFFDSLTSAFETAHPDLAISKKLREKVTRLQQTAVGGKVPGIVMTAANKDTVSLFSITEKYTLIDFWASWCGPCRRESDILNKLYEKYKDKGFTIYGVSLDTNEKQWTNAMAKDHRIWANVSSLQGFETPAAYNFAVTALPMNYLIDSKGIIIAKNLHGEELEKLVDQVMAN